MIETQAELRDAQEKVKDLQGKLHNLETQRAQMEDQKSCGDGHLDKLQDQVPEPFDLSDPGAQNQSQGSIMHHLKAE